MTNQAKRILRNAERLQRQGKAGDSIRLRLLAGEIRTVREGPVTVHGPQDVR